MSEKLSNEYVSIGLRFSEEQDAGRETINAMDNKRSLSLQCQPRRKQRQSGRTIRALDRHSRQASRLIDDHHGIVFVEHRKLP